MLNLWGQVFRSFCNNKLWLRLSKAFDISRSTSNEADFSSIAFKRFSETFIRAVSVEFIFLLPFFGRATVYPSLLEIPETACVPVSHIFSIEWVTMILVCCWPVLLNCLLWVQVSLQQFSMLWERQPFETNYSPVWRSQVRCSHSCLSGLEQRFYHILALCRWLNS